jgi:predicted DNA-binding transcriptional regulator AlpA
MTPERYLTPGQVAELLQISEKSVHRWAVSDATMPTLRLGGGTGKRAQLRFPESRLAAWLKGREQGLGRPQRSRKLLPSAPPGSRESAQVLDLKDGRSDAAGEPKAVGDSWAKPWAKSARKATR